MGGQTLRRKLHKVLGILPQEPSLAKQVVSLKCMPRIQSNGAEIERDPAALNVTRIQIHDHHNHTGKIVCGLAVANQCGVVRAVKTQAAVALKSRRLSADAVQSGNEISEACFGVQIPMLEFILLGVEVF